MNSMRISGIASGMDTETMIADLMKAERSKLNKFNKSKTLNTWRQEAYTNVNKSIANFILDSRKKLFGTSSYSKSPDTLSWVKKATSSNEGAFTASTTAGAATGTHEIDVVKLATGVNVASTARVKTTTNENATSTTTLDELGISDGSFEINGQTINVTTTMTIADLAKEINDSDSGVKASFDDTNGRMFLSTKNTGKSAKISIDNADGIFTGASNVFNIDISSTSDISNVRGSFNINSNGTAKLEDLFTGIVDGSININGADILFDATDTVNDLIINLKANDVEVEIIEDPVGEFYLEFGDDVHITTDTQNLFTGASNRFGINESVLLGDKTGQNAQINFDGATGLEYESNNITINGINITLNSQTTGAETLKVETDVNEVYDKIKEFVDGYNKLLGDLNKTLGEKRYRDFQPLIKEEKEAMKEDDIKLWEEKAKSGLLRNDDYITKTIGKVRGGLYDEVVGLSPFDSLFQVGITTGEWKDKGALKIDEDKLKEAIKNEPEGVMNLLFAPSDPNDSKNSGIVNRMFDNLTDGMKEIIKKSGTGGNDKLYRDVKSNILVEFVTSGGAGRGSISLLDDDAFNYDKIITREESRLTQIENRYWAQFSAMEKALSEMQSQSSWLMSQMG